MRMPQVIQAGRRATDGYEPRQVRKEAAISNAVCVADRSRPRYDLHFPSLFDGGFPAGFSFQVFFGFSACRCEKPVLTFLYCALFFCQTSTETEIFR